MKPILIIATVLACALSACGAKAVPTVDPAQVQASAVAAANTIVAMTQDAMPTETPVPPTEPATDTPQPTPTIPPLPTSPVLASPTVVASTSGGACNGPIDISKGETLGVFLVRNKTKQLVTVSFQLKQNKFGDCGYRSVLVSPNGTQVLNLPIISTYNVYAFNQTGKPDWQNAYFDLYNGYNTDKFTINLTVQGITVTPP